MRSILIAGCGLAALIMPASAQQVGGQYCVGTSSPAPQGAVVGGGAWALKGVCPKVPIAPPLPGSGNGLSIAVSRLPSDLPVTHWHLTARHWAPLNIPASSYLARVNQLVSWYVANTASNGCLNTTANPYQPSGLAGANGATAVSIGLQARSGNTANQAAGANALDCSVNVYHAGTNGGDFALTDIATAITLFPSDPRVGTWKEKTNFVQSGIPGNSNNWITYDMTGFWAMHQIGQSAFNIGAIESWWTGSCPTNCPNPGDGSNTTNQSQRMGFAPWRLYQDAWASPNPDSMAVERVGGANILSLVDDGYNGASAGAMTAAAETAALTDLLMAGADGSNPTGGRQSDHPWVDSGQQLTFDIMANRKHSSNPFLAGQYVRAAQMSFNQTTQYALPSSACCNGLLFNPTHSHNDPKLGVGQQNPGTTSDLFYNGTIMEQELVAYGYRSQFPVTEQPAPVEIGGYAFALPCGSGSPGSPRFCQSFLAAGGTAVQLATLGGTSIYNGQPWTALGIERIGRTGWTASLGPGDGYWSVIGGGISFGPTWVTSGTSWTRLAQNPSSCQGAFTTTFANPALTLAKVVWSCGAIVFTQNLTVDSDGVLSQTICSGCLGNFGMTFPVMTDNGTLSPNNFGASAYTTAIGTNAAGLAQTQAANGDQQNFMTIGGGTPTLVSEVTQNNSYGHLSAIRAWTGNGGVSDATQTTFVYPRTSADPAAAAVQANMTITGQNTYVNTALGSHVVSGADGTYYVGPTAAGGWASSVTGLLSFSAPCNFIARISAGHVTEIETDRAVIATVQAHLGLSLTAYTPTKGL